MTEPRLHHQPHLRLLTGGSGQDAAARGGDEQEVGHHRHRARRHPLHRAPHRHPHTHRHGQHHQVPTLAGAVTIYTDVPQEIHWWSDPGCSPRQVGVTLQNTKYRFIDIIVMSQESL